MVLIVICGPGAEIDSISSPDLPPFHHRLLGAVALPKVVADGAPYRSDTSPWFALRSRSKRLSACTREHETYWPGAWLTHLT